MKLEKTARNQECGQRKIFFQKRGHDVILTKRANNRKVSVIVKKWRDYTKTC